MPSAHAGRRDRASRLLSRLAVVAVVLAVVLSYGGRAVLRADPFADRAVAALRQPGVRDAVADHLTAALVRGQPDLVSVRPLVHGIATTVIGTGAFHALFRRAAVELHGRLTGGDGGGALLTVADAGVLVQGALERVAPDAARRVGAERLARLGEVHPGEGVLAVVRALRHVYRAAWALTLLGLVLAAAALWMTADRRRTARQLGIGLAAGGLVVVAVYVVGSAIAGQVAAAGRADAVRGLWAAFLTGLRNDGLWVAGAGAVLAAAATAGEGRAAEPWGLTTAAGVPRVDLARGLLLAGAGVAILFEPGAALTLAALAAGAWLLHLGVARTLHGAAAIARARRPGRRPWRRRALLAVVPAVALAAVAGAAAAIATGASEDAPSPGPIACNGYASLCDRPLNDVALAATHNSMASVTIPDWLFGQQDGTIADQLSYGIRGLLIDTYYGNPVAERIRTDFPSLPKRRLAVRALGAPAVDAAERIRNRLLRGKAGPRGIYLCHGFCEIGAVSLTSALTDLRDFLVSNPGAVVVIINQDEGVTPHDIVRAFRDAGLLEFVYRGPLGPFPTLGQMVASGRRLVVLAEREADDVPWYRLAYRHALAETPFTFKSAAALTEPAEVRASCRPNRGPASAPLFLLNHWVDTTPVPRASLAAQVNARPVLLARAETCRRIRDQLPNLVAVDFYRHGDVLGVVRTLNGLGR